MQIDIQTRGITLTEELRAHVVRRLQFALSRFQNQTLLITVCLSDVSGNRGEDHRCYLKIRAEGCPDVSIEDTEADLYVAINRAVERAGRMLERQWQRIHNHLNSPFQ
ncbi:ribosome hibernation-promoting factor, HPF/YfiA family [Pseudomonas sp.]|uniref:ribosome hibernation-promoting factor, HPF/YfiA family n=1 Tax=Pseudomonas sp. TaxID=306 RepID=UPI00286ABF3E|nr:ribosome-associated translation inhibitor RaiA [Pseudomonas sp.]